ncbi:hypothetical protein CRG98_022772 [Punica granatum]|uniref:Uncharacterized protein n=1 Tax=Punica granatum TaxID=22663 RepID=A0A2I0JKM4_PUNGR|nr:hypothetical protein CRG98_022772 [Punica granatum]
MSMRKTTWIVCANRNQTSPGSSNGPTVITRIDPISRLPSVRSYLTPEPSETPAEQLQHHPSIPLTSSVNSSVATEEVVAVEEAKREGLELEGEEREAVSKVAIRGVGFGIGVQKLCTLVRAVFCVHSTRRVSEYFWRKGGTTLVNPTIAASSPRKAGNFHAVGHLFLFFSQSVRDTPHTTQVAMLLSACSLTLPLTKKTNC